MARGRGGRGRGGRGRGGQGNRGGRGSNRGGGNKGGGSRGGKGKGKGKGASSGRRGGQGNRGRTSTSRNAASNKGNRGGYGKGGASTGRRGGQGNRNTPTGRARGTVSRATLSKGFRSIRNAMKGAAARAGEALGVKKKTKLQQQVDRFKSRVKEMSTPEAKRERIRRRMREQHGLDYDNLNPSFSVDVNVDRAMRHFNVPQNVRNMVPGPIKNIKFKKQFYSPTKLGASDGWGRKTGRYNKGGGRIPTKLGGQDPETQTALRKAYESGSTRLLPLEETLQRPQMGPQQDWLADLYRSHNINQGQLGQGARDYWSKQAQTKGRDAVIQSIIGTSKAQGTYGGRKKPRRITTGSKPTQLPPWLRRGHGHTRDGRVVSNFNKKQRGKR